MKTSARFHARLLSQPTSVFKFVQLTLFPTFSLTSAHTKPEWRTFISSPLAVPLSLFISAFYGIKVFFATEKRLNYFQWKFRINPEWITHNNFPLHWLGNFLQSHKFLWVDSASLTVLPKGNNYDLGEKRRKVHYFRVKSTHSFFPRINCIFLGKLFSKKKKLVAKNMAVS